MKPGDRRTSHESSEDNQEGINHAGDKKRKWEKKKRVSALVQIVVRFASKADVHKVFCDF